MHSCKNFGRHQLAEGIIWDAGNRRLLWVDIEGMALFWSDDLVSVTGSMRWDEYVTYVAPMPGGGRNDYLVAAGMSIYRVDIASGGKHLIAEIVRENADLRLNDGGIGPDGALYIGSMSNELRPGAGKLYRISLENGQIDTVLSGLSIPNGLVWNKDGTLAFLIDSSAHTVSRYDFDAQNGRFLHGANWIHIDDGLPDGMTVDENDNLWIAHYNGWKISVWDSLKPVRLREYDVPASFVTSCCFHENGDLYITTAGRGIAGSDRAKQPDAGGIFMIPSSELLKKG